MRKINVIERAERELDEMKEKYAKEKEKLEKDINLAYKLDQEASSDPLNCRNLWD